MCECALLFPLHFQWRIDWQTDGRSWLHRTRRPASSRAGPIIRHASDDDVKRKTQPKRPTTAWKWKSYVLSWDSKRGNQRFRWILSYLNSPTRLLTCELTTRRSWHVFKMNIRFESKLISSMNWLIIRLYWRQELPKGGGVETMFKNLAPSS